MAGSAVYHNAYLGERRQVMVSNGLADDMADAYPMQTMKRNSYLLGRQQERGGNGDETQPEGRPRSSSQVAWYLPVERELENRPSPAVTPAPPTPSADPNNNRNNNNPAGNRGIDKWSSYFLFYATLLQSFVKMSACIVGMSMDVKPTETMCNNEHAYCTGDTYSRATVFLAVLALFLLSSVDFCVGLCIFTQNRAFSSLTHDMIKGPMNVFSVVLIIEILVVILSNEVILVSQEVLMFVTVMLITELIAIFIVYLYPHPYYQSVDNPTLITEDTMITGTGNRSQVP